MELETEEEAMQIVLHNSLPEEEVMPQEVHVLLHNLQVEIEAVLQRVLQHNLQDLQVEDHDMVVAEVVVEEVVVAEEAEAGDDKIRLTVDG